MGPHAKQVLDAALQLSESERLQVAEALLTTVEDEPDQEADAAWAEEIERRTQEIERGLVDPIPWSIVKQSAGQHTRGKP